MLSLTSDGRCSWCHRDPQPGEEHQVLLGITEDGEPSDWTCLDADSQPLPFASQPPAHLWKGPPPF